MPFELRAAQHTKLVQAGKLSVFAEPLAVARQLAGCSRNLSKLSSPFPPRGFQPHGESISKNYGNKFDISISYPVLSTASRSMPSSMET